MWRIQDFLDSGRRLLILEQKTIISQGFCHKLNENEKNWTERGGMRVPSTPLDPPMNFCFEESTFFYFHFLQCKKLKVKRKKILKAKRKKNIHKKTIPKKKIKNNLITKSVRVEENLKSILWLFMVQNNFC